MDLGLALQVDAVDPVRVTAFWSGLLDRRLEGLTVPGASASDVDLVVVPRDDPKVVQNRIHLDLATSSDADRAELLERALALGARSVDVGQGPDAEDIVLADPEGNEFCVIEPGNTFLGDTGRIGAVNCDGTAALGRFWSATLGWPLVWDQDEETAIQSPTGGPKITWSGPPLMPSHGRDRLRLVLRGLEPALATARLESLGATVVAPGRLRDPDGNKVLVAVG